MFTVWGVRLHDCNLLALPAIARRKAARFQAGIDKMEIDK
ncbi:hypothetical protein ASAP_0435 [Asaia bogorensis]|uniref:Uncharacterized protein n=1 Tax=Asaia bogorensis TaxID=91915 RepID=A0A060QC32_9PROT|nr:hypothetical protein ASAP_0435 [Asaia bogorensis]